MSELTAALDVYRAAIRLAYLLETTGTYNDHDRHQAVLGVERDARHRIITIAQQAADDAVRDVTAIDIVCGDCEAAAGTSCAGLTPPQFHAVRLLDAIDANR